VAAGCGNDGGRGGVDSGGRPLLPIGESAGGGSAGTSQAMVKSADASTEAGLAMAPAPYQPVEYRLADGAQAPVTKAQAYELVRPKDDPVDLVAKALGVDPSDVETKIHAAWYYAASSPDTAVSSSSSASCAADPEAACDDAPPVEPQPLEGVPSAADAEAKGRTIFDALGLDDRGQVDVDGVAGQYQTVSYTPSVEGIPVPILQSTVQFGAHGRIEFAQGALFETKAIGEYPLVTLADAFDRYQHGFDGDGGGGVEADVVPAQEVTSAGAATEQADLPVRVPPTTPLPKAGAEGSGASEASPEPMPMPAETAPPVTLEPRIVEVTGARLVLEPVASGCEDDPIYLVPAFQLLPETDFGVVTAITDDSLAGTAGDKASAPDDEVCPEDEGDGDAEPGVVPPDAGSVEPQPAPAPDEPPSAGAGSSGSSGSTGAVTGSSTGASSGSGGAGVTGTGTAEPPPKP
jgi:hypothetical protein